MSEPWKTYDITEEEYKKIISEYLEKRKTKDYVVNTSYKNENKITYELTKYKYSMYGTKTLNQLIEDYVTYYNQNPFTLSVLSDAINYIHKSILDYCIENKLNLCKAVINTNSLCDEYYDNEIGLNFELSILIYESEFEFIKRRVKQLKSNKKAKLTKPSKVISELQKEIQELEKLKVQTERKIELKRSKLKGI
jgi:hypothetical protein